MVNHTNPPCGGEVSGQKINRAVEEDQHVVVCGSRISSMVTREVVHYMQDHPSSQNTMLVQDSLFMEHHHDPPPPPPPKKKKKRGRGNGD